MPLTELPQETLSEIALHLDTEGRQSFALSCRVCWAPGSRLLWEEVYGVERLFALMIGEYPRTRPESDEEEEAHDWQWDREFLVGRMPNSINETQFERFKAYAPFVKSLYLVRGILSPGFHQALIARRPLLPNLQTLYINGSPTKGLNWSPKANDIEDMTLLFLSSKVKNLSLWCNELAIDPTIVTQAAPDLRHLALGCTAEINFEITTTAPHRLDDDYSSTGDTLNLGIDLETTWGDWAVRCGVAFKDLRCLSKLTVTGTFLQAQGSLLYLSQFSRLQHLTISESILSTPSATFVPGDYSLPALTQLTLLHVTVPGLEPIFQCTPLISGIHELCIRPQSGWMSYHQAFKQAVELLGEHAGSLRILRLHGGSFRQGRNFFVWDHSDVAQPMLRLGLTHFHLEQRFAQVHSGLPVLTGLGPQLTHLDLGSMIIPLRVLPSFAFAYRELSYLSCRLELAPKRGDALPVIEKSAFQPITLTGGFRESTPTTAPEEAGDIIWGLDDTARYLKAIWPNLTLTPREYEEFNFNAEEHATFLELKSLLRG